MAIFIVIAFMIFSAMLSAGFSLKWYDCLAVQIDAAPDAQEATSLVVSESRDFNFHGFGGYEAVYIGVGNNLPQNVFLTARDISQVQLNGKPLQQAAWSSSFKEENPPYEAWSYDASHGNLWFFFQNRPPHISVSYQYVIQHAITHYSDVNELYWKYVGGWSVPTTDVTCTVHLLPAEKTAMAYTKGDDVRAWGHGSAGTVDISDTDATVTFHNGYVPAGVFAEARIVYPAAWATGHISPLDVRSEEGLPHILAEEEQYAALPPVSRFSIADYVCWALVGASILLVGLTVFVLVRAKKWRKQFFELYYRDVPQKGASPAYIAYLLRNAHSDIVDVVANLMDMAERHIISIAQSDGTFTITRLVGAGAGAGMGAGVGAGAGMSADVGAGAGMSAGANADNLTQDFSSSRAPSDSRKTSHSSNTESFITPSDSATLSFIFDKCCEGKDTIVLKEVENFAKKNPREFLGYYKDWERAIKAQVAEKDWFADNIFLKLLDVLSLPILIGLALSCLFAVAFPPVIIGLIVLSITWGLCSLFMRRYARRCTSRGEEVAARALALRRWLLDFTNLKESIPTDAKVWGEFLVYAYLFGIAEKVVKQLKLNLPQLFEERSQDRGSYIPVFYGYMDVGRGGAAPGGAAPFAGAAGGVGFTQALSNSMQSAMQSAFSASMKNVSASAGGGGGGFSGGGGGGFGGGGGGAR